MPPARCFKICAVHMYRWICRSSTHLHVYEPKAIGEGKELGKCMVVQAAKMDFGSTGFRRFESCIATFYCTVPVPSSPPTVRHRALPPGTARHRALPPRWPPNNVLIPREEPPLTLARWLILLFFCRSLLPPGAVCLDRLLAFYVVVLVATTH